MTGRSSSASPLNPKTCKQITDLVLAYLNNQLGPRVTQTFERHLSICPDCVSFFNTYKKTIQTTRSVDPAQMPAKVRDNMLSFLRQQMRHVGSVLIYFISQLGV